MLTTEYRNIINDAIKYELSYNLGKARNVLFIVFCKDLNREWKSRRFIWKLSCHKIRYRCREYCGPKKLNKTELTEPLKAITISRNVYTNGIGNFYIRHIYFPCYHASLDKFVELCSITSKIYRFLKRSGMTIVVEALYPSFQNEIHFAPHKPLASEDVSWHAILNTLIMFIIVWDSTYFGRL